MFSGTGTFSPALEIDKGIEPTLRLLGSLHPGGVDVL